MSDWRIGVVLCLSGGFNVKIRSSGLFFSFRDVDTVCRRCRWGGGRRRSMLDVRLLVRLVLSAECQNGCEDQTRIV